MWYKQNVDAAFQVQCLRAAFYVGRAIAAPSAFPNPRKTTRALQWDLCRKAGRSSIDARWKVISPRGAKRHIVNRIVSPEHAIWDLSAAIVPASERPRTASVSVQKTWGSDRSLQFARIARLIWGSDSGRYLLYEDQRAVARARRLGFFRKHVCEPVLD